MYGLCACFWEENPHVLPFNNHRYRSKREKGQKRHLEGEDTDAMNRAEEEAGTSGGELCLVDHIPPVGRC